MKLRSKWQGARLRLRSSTRRALVLVLPLFAACVHPTAPPAALHLTLEPVVDQGAYQSLSVTLNFKGCEAGRTRLKLPDAWGGEAQLYKALRDVRADGATLQAGATPAEFLLAHAPGQPITVRYRIVDDATSVADQPKQDGNDYRPVIKPRHFHVLGNAIVAQPECVSQSAPARFTLRGLPPGDSFASDLEHQAMGRALTVGDLIESVLVGGDFRVLDAGGGARLAVRGHSVWTDAQWKDNFSRVAAAVRGYWRSAGEPYLVTILSTEPPSPGHVSVGGTGRSDAFAFFATSNAQPPVLIQTMAHEMTHSWVPRRIGRLAEKNEASEYWLSEGLTEWAAWRALLRAGVWTPEDYAGAFNAALKNYDSSVTRNAPNSQIEQAFWRDPAAQQLPYQRGMLLAAHWDAIVLSATRGQKRFDDVLYEMQRRAQGSGEDKALPLAVPLLKQAMQSVAGVDITQDLAIYVERGDTVPVDAALFEPCGAVKTIDRPVFHRGFDVDRTIANGHVINGVVPGGPAHRAGLRDGMKLVARRAGEIGDATVEIAYEVIDAVGQTRTLRWLPVGSGRTVYRQLQLTPKAVQPACARQLGGQRAITG